MLFPALLFGLAQAVAPPAYRITYSAEAPRMVHVEAEFVVRDSVLQMYGYGAEHLPDGWRTFVRNERLATRSGRPLRLERLPERKWKAFARAGEPVRLSYDVAIEHDRGRWIPDAREAAYARDWGVFAVGRALFIYDDADARNIDLAFTLPPDWRVTTAWPEVGPARFRADTWGDAIQSIIFAGRFTAFDVVEGPVTVSFAVGGPGFAESRTLLTAVTRDLLRSYTALFGGAPAARLVVVLNPDSTVMGGGGGVFRRSISMTFGTPPTLESIYAWGHTIAHEFFHIWNATAMRRASESEEWLLEGNADYYAVLTMARLGYFPVPIVLAKLGGAFANYARVAGQMSLAQAGLQEWQGSGPAMLYNGGWTTAFSLDIAIRRATMNTKSLDDVMRDLYGRFGNTGRPLTNQELFSTAGRVAGVDLGDFFRRYVDGKERVPVAEYLAHIGLELEGSRVRPLGTASPAQMTARAAYFGPRARTDGPVPEWATRGHDPDVNGGRFDPAGRYEVVMHRTDGDMALDIVIAEAKGTLTAIVTGPGGSIVADSVMLSGTRLAVAFQAHGTAIRLDFAVKLDGVDGTWVIAPNSGPLTGKKARR